MEPSNKHNTMALIQCPSCGQTVSDQAHSCPKCGHTFSVPSMAFNQPSTPIGPKPDNHLVWSILSTFLCCLVGGIVAWVYSSKVDSSWNYGRYNEAVEYSNKAKSWNLISLITGICWVILYTVLSILGVIGAAASY